MEKLFEIKNLSVQYTLSSVFSTSKNKIFALNNINLDIYKGEILGLVGESGCGKSTFGKAVLNLIKPSYGEILFKKKYVFDKKQLKKYRKEAQLIFQNPFASLNPRMNIYKILEEPLIVHNFDKNEIPRIIKKIIETVGLSESVLSSYPHEFSGGQRQRIAIARALIINPSFIVADEPVSALDVSIQAQIINLLLELRQKFDLTILFISHDLNVVKYVSNRIAVMYLGEIVEIGTKDEIFNSPLHPYTKTLLASIPSIKIDKKKEIIKTELPSYINLPKGCKFYDRCTLRKDSCQNSSPTLIPKTETHFCRCFLV